MRRRTKKPKGKKAVSYELIDAKSPAGAPMYAVLRELVKNHHEDLEDAKIALAWNTSWRPDVDGLRVVAKLRRASDLDRELAPYDFVLLVLKPYYQDAMTSDVDRRRLIDRALCHGKLRLDDRTLEPVTDARGRKIYRTRKAPIQEFPEIIQRYGFDPRNIDLQLVAREAVMRRQNEVWSPCEKCSDSPDGPGFISVVQQGVRRVARCDCWTGFHQRRAEVAAVAS